MTGRRFYTSDHHFNHVNVILYCNRPFKTVEEMNFEMVRRWNAIVRPEDEVWVLGDFTMNFPSAEQFFPLLQGSIHLVAGNHDKCHPAAQKGRKEKQALMTDQYLKLGFKSVQTSASHRIGKTDVLLHHFPYRGEGDPNARQEYVERYTEHRPINRGQWLLHGHVHHHWKFKGRGINVGVDVWDFSPVPEATLQRIIEGNI